jgi:hypothetical protein
MMKQIGRSLLLFGLLSLAAPVSADSDQERVAAARRYLAVAQMSKVTDDTVTEMAKAVPSEQREKFLEFMHDAVRPQVLEQAALASMVKIFTADELNALADFFGSPIGQSAMGKFGLYMADVMPVIQQEMFHALQKLPADKR